MAIGKVQKCAKNYKHSKNRDPYKWSGLLNVDAGTDTPFTFYTKVL